MTMPEDFTNGVKEMIEGGGLPHLPTPTIRWSRWVSARSRRSS